MLIDLYAYITSADTSGLDTARATAIAVIRSMIGTRMYPEILDEATPMPSLVYSLVDNGTEHTLDGANDGLFTPRVQIDVFSMSAIQRLTLGEAVKTALDGYTQSDMGSTFVNALLWDNEIDSYESERKQYRKMLDFRVIHN